MIRRTFNFTQPITKATTAAASSTLLATTTMMIGAKRLSSGRLREVFHNPSDAEMKEVLEKMKTLVVIGLSTDKTKPSYHVASEIMNREGQSDEKTKLTLIPVRPVSEPGMKILGAEVKASLKDIPEEILQDDSTLVDVFRKSSDVPAVIDECLKLGVKHIWLQQGVFDNDACMKAQVAGRTVVANKCLMIEHHRLLNEQW